NGRISRAIADMALSQADGQANRFYSMSSQIRKERKIYYEILEKTQKGKLDITQWLLWFLNCLDKAIALSEKTLGMVLNKSRFWEQHSDKSLNERQIKMLNLLFDGFKGKLTTSKWAKLTNCSQDTAARDINNLCEHGILKSGPGGGRSTNYLLKDYPINSL
ncbi:MAG: Fic family protein, partial [Coxiellaceae bacterium]|nr:Fic family protein [Coxiellaceae bacterium]